MILHISFEAQEVNGVDLKLEVKKLEDRDTKDAGCLSSGPCLDNLNLGLTMCGT